MIVNYGAYKDGAPGAAGLELARQNFAWVLPYHEGAVRAFREAGVWKPEHEAHNQAALKRQADARRGVERVPEGESAGGRRRLPQGLDGGARGRAEEGRVRHHLRVVGAACPRADADTAIRMRRRPGRSRRPPRPRRCRGAWRVAARRRRRGHDLPVRQPAVRAALLRRLHAAQHRVLLRARAGDAAVRVRDLPGHAARAARPRAVVRRRALRGHCRRRALPDAPHPQGGGARLGVRRRAGAGGVGRLLHVGAADGGAAPHRRLEPRALHLAVHVLPALRRRGLAGPAARHAVHAGAGERVSRAVLGEPARHPAAGLRGDGDRLPRLRHRADDDRGRHASSSISRSRCAAPSAAARRRSASSRAGCSA